MKKYLLMFLAISAAVCVKAQKIDSLLNKYGDSPIYFSVKVPDVAIIIIRNCITKNSLSSTIDIGRTRVS